MVSITGPTICATSGLCVPGASCAAVERFAWVCFVRFPWANSATAMPRRQNTEAVKIRRLKKADCEMDFFFIDGVVSLRSRVPILPDTLAACQHFFTFFPKFSLKRLKPRMKRISRMVPLSEISHHLMASLVFRGNVTALLPFGARYPQDKSAPGRRTRKKRHRKDARSAHVPVLENFGPRNRRMMK